MLSARNSNTHTLYAMITSTIVNSAVLACKLSTYNAQIMFDISNIYGGACMNDAITTMLYSLIQNLTLFGILNSILYNNSIKFSARF